MKRFKALQVYLIFIMLILSVFLITGCGGGGGEVTEHWAPGMTLVSIAVTPATASVPVTGTQQYTATATYSNGSTIDRTTASTWTSGTPVNASVNATSGLATGNVAGTSSVITATFDGMTATATLTVNTATSKSFVVTPKEASIPATVIQQYTATETFSDGSTFDRTAASTWTAVDLSGGPNVATIVATTGLATGKVAGKSTITATYAVSPFSPATAILTVNTATSVSFKVTPLTASTSVGGAQQFAAIEEFSDGTFQDRTTTSAWSTSGASAANASVGAATGLAFGITVTPAGVPVVINATFTPSVGPALVATPANLTVVAAILPPASCAGPGPVDMGAADSFGVLVGPAGGATLTVTNPTSVTGDTGAASYVPAVGVSTLVGTKYTGTSAPYVNAQAAMLTAISCASARACSAGSAFNINADYDFGGKTLAPGVYCVTGGMSVDSNLTLSTPGVYIFRSTGALTSSNTITMAFGGTANATNTSVFWVPTGAASIGTDNAFLGTIMPGASAATTLGANTTLLPGRVLSNSDVTLDNNTIAKPTY